MFRIHHLQTIVWLAWITEIAFLALPRLALASVADDMRFETSGFMGDTAYRRPEKIAADSAPTGAESSSS
jgi:hypothetical protein